LASTGYRRCISVALLGCACLLVTVAHSGELIRSAELATAPGFTLKDLQNQTHRLEDYRGKVVLVNFWATWCPPCIAELPSMQRLAGRMTGESLEVLTINVQESRFRVWKFMKVVGVQLTVLLDEDRSTFDAWDASVFPTSYLVDTEGKIRYTASGPLQWDGKEVLDTLDSLLHPGQ